MRRPLSRRTPSAPCRSPSPPARHCPTPGSSIVRGQLYLTAVPSVSLFLASPSPPNASNASLPVTNTPCVTSTSPRRRAWTLPPAAADADPAQLSKQLLAGLDYEVSKGCPNAEVGPQ